MEPIRRKKLKAAFIYSQGAHAWIIEVITSNRNSTLFYRSVGLQLKQFSPREVSRIVEILGQQIALMPSEDIPLAWIELQNEVKAFMGNPIGTITSREV